MPIYEFHCPKCDEVFEVLVPRPSDNAEPCPLCGSGETQKLLSVASGIISQGDSFAGCPMPCAPACPRPGMGGRNRRKPGNFGGMGGGCPLPPFN